MPRHDHGSEGTPPLIHFVWLGSRLPDFAAFAIASAQKHNPECSVVLWHEPALSSHPGLERLVGAGLRLQLIAFSDLMGQARALNPDFDVERLGHIYRRLSAPAARSNLIRLVVLYAQGGIYLDTDTLTLRSLGELRKESAFCGREHVLWPSGRSKWHVGGLSLDAFRFVCGHAPFGDVVHSRFLSLYTEAANNAVLGFARAHPFCGALLSAATSVPQTQWLTRYRLGTRLLQDELAHWSKAGSASPVIQLPPHAFFPQGPVMSLHYFQRTWSVERKMERLVHRDTYLVHWYASVSTLKNRGSAYVLAHAKHQVYSHMCAPYAETLSAPAPQ